MPFPIMCRALNQSSVAVVLSLARGSQGTYDESDPLMMPDAHVFIYCVFQLTTSMGQSGQSRGCVFLTSKASLDMHRVPMIRDTILLFKVRSLNQV
jgi:hypothetical protein